MFSFSALDSLGLDSVCMFSSEIDGGKVHSKQECAQITRYNGANIFFYATETGCLEKYEGCSCHYYSINDAFRECETDGAGAGAQQELLSLRKYHLIYR